MNSQTEVCDLCAGVAKNILMFNKDLPIARAYSASAEEFETLHNNDDCIVELICLPVRRLRYKLISYDGE